MYLNLRLGGSSVTSPLERLAISLVVLILLPLKWLVVDEEPLD